MINIKDKYYINEYLYTYILVEFILHLNSNTKVQLKWKKINQKKQKKEKKEGLWSRLVPRGLRASSAMAAPLVPVGVSNRDQRSSFVLGSLNRDEFSPPFVPPWRFWLGNWDNRGFLTGTNRLFCSSGGSDGLWLYYFCVQVSSRRSRRERKI